MKLRETRLWYMACVFMLAVYLASVPNFWQCEGVDEIDYLSLAHSLVLGKGYTIYGRPHVLYPPLFASLMSLVIRFAGVGAWRLMYSVNAVLGIAGLILMGTWLRRRFERAGRWTSWFLLIAYYPWSFSCRFLMSEPLFLPISFSLLILVWRVLERDAGLAWEYAAIALLSLLAGMTRAAAVSLNLAIVCAGLVRWLITRRRTGLAVALLALIFGVGFFAYWSVRADIVNPNAPESHWRWAKKYLGLSRETQGIIAQGEEVTETSRVFHRRVLFAAQRYGQFVASVVRPPRGFLPLGISGLLLFAVGLIRHARSHPWSPFAWYVPIFLAMILKTTWLSNYLRFYVVLSPLLFLFLAGGVRWYWGKLTERNPLQAAAAVLLLAWSLLGIVAAWAGGAEGEGYIALYQRVWRWMLVAFWGIMAGTALGCFSGRVRPMLVAVAPVAVVCLWFVLAGQSLALIGLRTREGWKNSTLRFRRLDGVASCARWIRETGCGTGALVASLPQVPSFLSGCVFESPSYGEDGGLHLVGVERILLMGQLHEVPFFRPAQEERLHAAVQRAEQEGRLVAECRCGQAVLYRATDAALSP